MKLCFKCKKEPRIGKRGSYCRGCQAELSQKWRDENRERYNELARNAARKKGRSRGVYNTASSNRDPLLLAMKFYRAMMATGRDIAENVVENPKKWDRLIYRKGKV